MKDAAKIWLDAQCRIISTTQSALLFLLADQDGTSETKVFWPHDRFSTPQIQSIAGQALQQGSSVFYDEQQSNTASQSLANSIIGFPIVADNKIIGALAIEIKPCSLQDKKKILEVLSSGCIWLQTLLKTEKKIEFSEQLYSVFNLTSATIEKQSFHASASALATELATKLNCSRVSLGVVQDNTVKLKALSHTAVFNKKNDLINSIEAVMVEALDAQDAIYYSTDSIDLEHVTRAHNKIALKYNNGLVCSVPLINGNKIFGVLVLEKETIDLSDNFKKHAETVGILIGPILALKHKAERPLLEKARHSFRDNLSKIYGPKNIYFKFVATACATAIVFLSFSSGLYKISAESHLEGQIQRAIVAPIDGYIKDASVRAGDIVSEGDLLALIDDKDLRIERLKWDGERVQREKQYRLALASYERAEARILSAQIQQAEAKVALIDEQIQRTKILAPLGGIVVSGDLSQSLGSPVKRGDDLFEVAPLNQYRVILNIDESEIGDVQIGQSGHLVLSSAPGDSIVINVNKITPVSIIENGKNYFKVEAALLEVTDKLRPGMKGIAKLEVDHRKLIWIWTHKLIDRLRLWAWALLS